MLIDHYHALSRREQLLLIFSAPVIILLLLWILMVKPIIDSHNSLTAKIASNQAKLAWMQSNAVRTGNSRNSTNGTSANNKSQLRQQMNKLLKRHNLSVERIQNINRTNISYRFDNAKFNSVLRLIDNIEKQQIGLAEVQFSTAKLNGFVNSRLVVAFRE